MISKFELEELIEELEKIRGSHTELVSVYIPAGQNINVVGKQVEEEKGTASNIKSKVNRKNVVDALESISRELKKYKKTSENGMAIFSGNVSEKEGQQDIRLWIIEPPQPLKIRMYRCDKQFVLEPLKEMLEVEEVYGLIVMDRREATLGLLEGKQIKVLRKMTSGVPGKTEKGGQCLSPDTLIETNKGIKSIKEIKIDDLIKSLDIKNKKIIYTKCLNKWKKLKEEHIEIFFNKNKINSSLDHTFFIKKNDKIIEKEADKIKSGDVLISDKLEYMKITSLLKTKNKLMMIDIETESKNFFANNTLVHNSAARFARFREGLAKQFYRRISDAMKELYFDMPKLKGIIIGGPVPTKEDFLKQGELVTKLKEKIIGMKDIGQTDESGLQDLVETSKDLLEKQEIIHEKKLLERFFELLGKGKLSVYKKADIEKALRYGAIEILILSKKLGKEEIKELTRKAESISAKVEIVSDETEEGKQFLNLSGIGAILRFEI